jgi:RES domain/HEPN/RES N-terminal domain 1
VIQDEGAANHAGVLAHLAQAWDGQPWIRRDAWALSDHEALGAGWERFREIVTHQRRYWFTLAGPDPNEPTAVPPDRMLPAVGDAIEQAGVVRRFVVGSRLFRAHTHHPGERLTGSERLGAPPASKASANRMSPAGIPLFYAAEDQETAVTEVEAAETDPDRSAVTVGVFETTRDLVIVDLCGTLEVPGLFDEAQASTRGAVRFLQSFVSQVAEPVVRDGSEHVEYVPTQVFSEWLRWEFHPWGDPVDGVRYASSRTGGACVALFVAQDVADRQERHPAGDSVRLTDELR